MHLPVNEIGDRFALRVPWWRTWLEHDSDDEFWQPLEVIHHFDRLPVPVFHVGGWFDDLFVHVPFENFTAAKSDGQRLLVGPWGHFHNERTDFGGIDYGPGALIELWELEKRWLDHWLSGAELEDEPPVRLFVMGPNEWRSYREWPPEPTRTRELFLRSGGRLSFTAPADEAPDAYRYDPLDPTPRPWDFGEPITAGDEARWPPDASVRDDRLLYVSEPLEEPLTVIGSVRLRLHAETSGPDTDWFAWIAWEDPESGTVRLLTYGYAIRARFRHGFDRPQLLEPGEIFAYEIDLGATARVLPVGAVLHCCVQSSCSPWFARNLNTGGDNHGGVDAVIVEQRVYHDSARPSALLLQVE
jgi:putative CocE/NonD family hydrolase